MRPRRYSLGTAGMGILSLTIMISGCSGSAGNKAGGGTAISPTPAVPSGSTSSSSPRPSPSSPSPSSPAPSHTATPAAVSTPPPCHPRVGKCLTVLSQGDAINVRAAPNTKAKILGTISSGYQVEVLCVGKGQSVAGPKGRTIYWDAVDQGWISDAYVGASGKVKACQ